MNINPLKRLSVRPTLKLGESLSSYLFRLCFCNRISLGEFIKLISKRRITKRDWFTIDVFPTELIDLEKLSIQSGCDVSSLLKHSYGVIYNKIYGETDKKRRPFKLDLNKLLVKDRRKFCISCLAQTDTFKLIWQVKKVNLCSLHKQHLVDSCPSCGNVQPYFHERLAKKKCYHCDSHLYGQEKGPISLVDEDNGIVENWSFLLDPRVPVITNKFGLRNEQEIALSLLFAQRELSSKKILGRSVEDRLKALIRNSNRQRSILLSDLLYMSEKSKMTIRQLLDLHIDGGFVADLTCINDIENLDVACISPWCIYKGSNKKMNKVSSSFQSFKDKYTEIWICTSCYMRYGLNKNTMRWDSVENEVLITNSVKEMLLKGESIREISKVAKSKTYKVIGYVLFHGLLPSESPVKYKIGNIPVEDVSFFYKIFNGSMAFNNLYSRAKEMFQWNPYELGYYLSTPVVQQELFLTPHIRRKKYYQSKSIVKKRIEGIVNSITYSEGELSLLKIAESLHRNPSILRHYTLNKNLVEEITTYNQVRKNAEFTRLKRLVEKFFEVKKKKLENLLIKDVYSYLDVNRSYIRRNYLQLDHYISQKVKNNNDEYKKSKEKLLVPQAIRVTRSLLEKGEHVTIEKISKFMGISVATLYEHSEVIEAINLTRRQL
ncbi:TniQ family protein [Cytobacillus firmus]